MRRALIIVLLLTIVPGLSSGLAQNLANNSDILAVIDFQSKQIIHMEELGQAVKQGLSYADEDTPRSVKISFDPIGEYENWLENNHSRYFVAIEFQAGKWQVDKGFKIPFMLNIYEKRYHLAAAVKVYRRGIPRPIMARQIEQTQTGSKSYQILRDNPHDGALLLAQGLKLKLEDEAEIKLIEKISGEVAETMNEYGG